MQLLAPPKRTAKGSTRAGRCQFFERTALVLDDVSFRVRVGEFRALVGPSSSGKSTVMRLLLGFMHADRICVLADGKIVETGGYEELISRPGPFQALAKRRAL